MTPDFSIRQGDRLPAITATLVDASGAVVDLTGATAVRFHLSLIGTATRIVQGTGTIVDAPTGKVSYAWSTNDTAVAGEFYGEWEVDYAAGVTRTFPSGGYLWIEILPGLA